MSEAYADGLANNEERRVAWDAAWEVDEFLAGSDASDAEVDAAASALTAGDGPGSVRWSDGFSASITTAVNASMASAKAAGYQQVPTSLVHAQLPELAAQANLLRHIIGNPWRPLIFPAQWLATVVKLAEAIYSGEDCSMALHDAFLECGQDSFAEHFRESFHPKGCAWVDMILNKC
jgi:hypothetical protein